MIWGQPAWLEANKQAISIKSATKHPTVAGQVTYKSTYHLSVVQILEAKGVWGC